MTTAIAWGSAADFVDRAALQQQHALRQTTALGIQAALDELSEVWEECQLPGWDGYGAKPVGWDTLDAAHKLLESLPYGFPLPSISAQPDGLLTMEWHRTPRRTFSISVDPDGLIHYAGLFGPEKQFGTVIYFDRLPEKILRLAGEV